MQYCIITIVFRRVSKTKYDLGKMPVHFSTHTHFSALIQCVGQQQKKSYLINLNVICLSAPGKSSLLCWSVSVFTELVGTVKSQNPVNNTQKCCFSIVLDMQFSCLLGFEYTEFMTWFTQYLYGLSTPVALKNVLLSEDKLSLSL